MVGRGLLVVVGGWCGGWCVVVGVVLV